MLGTLASLIRQTASRGPKWVLTLKVRRRGTTAEGLSHSALMA